MIGGGVGVFDIDISRTSAMGGDGIAGGGEGDVLFGDWVGGAVTVRLGFGAASRFAQKPPIQSTSLLSSFAARDRGAGEGAGECSSLLLPSFDLYRFERTIFLTDSGPSTEWRRRWELASSLSSASEATMVAAAAEVLASGALLPPAADDGPARGSSEVERRRRGCRRSFMSASR